MARKNGIRNLYHRGGVWYVRKQVPVDLQAHFPSKDIQRSLKTTDRREAERRRHAALAKLEDAFTEKRQEMEREERARLYAAGEAFRKAARDAEGIQVEMPRGGLDDPQRALKWIDGALGEIAYERQTTTLAVRHLPDEQEPIWAVPARFLKPIEAKLEELWSAEEARLQALKREIESRGEAKSPDRLDGLMEAWKAERKPAPNTVRALEQAIRLFEEVAGPLRYAEITGEHVRQFKAHLLGLDRKAQTVAKLWGMLRALLNHAAESGLIPASPFEGIGFAPKQDGAEREDFSRSDLEALFSKTRKGSEEWWLLRLGLYTGARLGELHQLTGKDARQEDGVWLLDLNEDDGKSLKNRNSRRKVPLHAQLIVTGR